MIDKLRDDEHYYGEYGKKDLSNSDIGTLLSNPQSYGVQREKTPEMVKGSYLHTLVLEPGKAFNFRTISASSRNTKKYKEESEGEVILLDSEAEEVAADGIIASKYRVSGQTCVSANRIIAQPGIADALVAALQKRVDALKPGDGFDGATDIGPLIHHEAVERVDALVKDARDSGATILAGGKPLTDELGGAFYAPTLIEGGNPSMDLACFEIFGPVASVYRAESEEEIIKLANDTPYGLAAYLYTNDVTRIHRMTEALEYGMIGVNAPMVGAASTPFGGVKESGIGREGGKWGVEEFTELRYVLLGGVE